MSILLINPPVYDFAAFDLWAKPLGLLYVAAGLRAAGYDVRWLDCMDRSAPELKTAAGPKRPRARAFNTGDFYWEEADKPPALREVPRRYRRYGLPAAAIAARLRGMDRPALALVGSMMTYWYPGVAEAVDLVRAQWPDVRVAVGGLYATLCSTHARRRIGADIVVEGPGLDAALRLAEEATGRPPRPDAERRLLKLRPAFDLYGRPRSAALLTSLGCPFRCTYCATPLLRPRYERRNVEDAADDAAALQALGAQDVAFYDDALLVAAEEHFLPLSRRLRERAPGLRFHTPNGLHARFVTRAVAQALWDAGVRTVRLSLEGVDADARRRSSGKVDPEEFARAVSHLRAVGYEKRHVGAYLLVGAPGQDPAQVEASILFVHETGAQAKLAEFSPIPGSPDFARAAARLPDIADEPLLHNNTVYCLLSGDADPAELDRLKQLAKELNRA